MSASCCEGAVSTDSGKRERSSATSNFVLMAAIMVPARADGDAGRSRARQQDLEADLGEEGQPNCQQVLEPVHQQPHGVDGEDLLPRKRAQPHVQAAPRGCSSFTAASSLGARGSSRDTARTALRPRRPQMRPVSLEVMARIGLS